MAENQAQARESKQDKVKLSREGPRYKALVSLAIARDLNVENVLYDPQNNELEVVITYPPGKRNAAKDLESYLLSKPEDLPQEFKDVNFKITIRPDLSLNPLKPLAPATTEENLPTSLAGQQRKPFSRLSLLPTSALPTVSNIALPSEGQLEVSADFSSLSNTELPGGVVFSPEEALRRRAYQYALPGALARFSEAGALEIDSPQLEEQRNLVLQGFLRDVSQSFSIKIGDEEASLSDLLAKENLSPEETSALKKILFGKSRVSDEDFQEFWGLLKAAYNDPAKMAEFLDKLNSQEGYLGGLLGDLKEAYTTIRDESNVEALVSRMAVISKVVYFDAEQNIMVAKLIDSPTREVYVEIHLNEETGAYEIRKIEDIKTQTENGRTIKYYKQQAGATIRWDESSRYLDSFLFLRGDVGLKFIKEVAYGEYKASAGAGARLKLGPVGVFGAVVGTYGSEVEPTSSLILLNADGTFTNAGTFERIQVNELQAVLGIDLQILKNLKLATQVFAQNQWQRQSSGLSLLGTKGISSKVMWRVGEGLTLSLGTIYAVENTPLGERTQIGIPLGAEIGLPNNRILGISGTLTRVDDPITGPYWRAGVNFEYHF